MVFNTEAPETYIMYPFPHLCIHIVCTCVFRVFGVDCGSSRVPAGRGVHWLAIDVLIPVVCESYVYCRITLVCGLASCVDRAMYSMCGLAFCVDRAFY